MDWNNIDVIDYFAGDNKNVSGSKHTSNKCIGDDTKAAARPSLSCIENKIK